LVKKRVHMHNFFSEITINIQIKQKVIKTIH